MTIKKGLFIAFAAIILLVPVYVAVSSLNVLNNGEFYKFKPMAYDPFDPFRGKFLRVNYETNNIPTKFDFEENETAYVSIGVDGEGFAFFEEAFKSPPEKKDYLKTTVNWSGIDARLQREIEMAIELDDFNLESIDTRSSVNIKIPDNMNKYFINEDDALLAEKTFIKEQENIYIGVRILNGEVRLENIYVYDQPILDYLDSKK
jgi:uncharacterized membrane-anchored protein